MFSYGSPGGRFVQCTLLATRKELVARIRLGDDVRPLAAVVHVDRVVFAREEAIVAVAAVEEVGVVAARDLVVAGPALHDVLARHSVELVVRPRSR